MTCLKADTVKSRETLVSFRNVMVQNNLEENLQVSFKTCLYITVRKLNFRRSLAISANIFKTSRWGFVSIDYSSKIWEEVCSGQRSTVLNKSEDHCKFAVLGLQSSALKLSFQLFLHQNLLFSFPFSKSRGVDMSLGGLRCDCPRQLLIGIIGEA